MLDRNLAAEILNEALSTGGDFAEIFMENTRSESIRMEEREVKDIASNIKSGIGIRVFKDLFQTYAYTNVMTRENLLKTAKKAAFALQEKRQITIVDLNDLEFVDRNRVLVDPTKVSKSAKVDLMKRGSEYLYAESPMIKKASSDYFDIDRNILVANSEGVWAEDRQVRTGLTFSAIAEKDGVKDSGGDRIGGLAGFELFDKEEDIKKIVAKVANEAVSKLFAVNAPSGKMPVVIGNGFGGVLFHEACGHSLEATSVAKGASEFCNKLGCQVASDLVTAVDDATDRSSWGAFNFDDEGNVGRKKVLIENGILKEYMIDKFNARRMGVEANGSSRRQDYTFIPTSRMSSTYIANGKSSFEEIIANTEYGLYAKRFSGGSVHPITGNFNFSASIAFMIRNGKIAEQVKGVKLIGKGEDILKNIDMVGNDIKPADGNCGSASGRVPVGSYQPTVRVKEITVGGQE